MSLLLACPTARLHLRAPSQPCAVSPLRAAEAGKQLDIVRSPLDLRDLVTDVHCIIEAMVGKEVKPGRRRHAPLAPLFGYAEWLTAWMTLVLADQRQRCRAAGLHATRCGVPALPVELWSRAACGLAADCPPCCAMPGLQRGVALLPPDLDGAPATVLGDPSRICGILLNLYTNAGGPTHSPGARQRRTADWQPSVSPGGGGMAPQEQGRLGEPRWPLEAAACIAAEHCRTPNGRPILCAPHPHPGPLTPPPTPPPAAKYTKKGSILLRVHVVGPSYRPDPAVALAFCEAHSGSGAGVRPDSRASRSFSSSMPDSAPDTSGRSTPTGVLPAPAGEACGSGGSKPGVKAGGAAGGGLHHALYQHGRHPEHDSVKSLEAAGSAASDAAALLSRQAAAASSGEAHTVRPRLATLGAQGARAGRQTPRCPAALGAALLWPACLSACRADLQS